jgi:very-short-patch-repair endonuclease
MSTYTRSCVFCNNSFITSDKNKKFCNLSCSTSNKNKVTREKKLLEYSINPKRCLRCDTAIAYHCSTVNKFCSKSCAGIYNNQRKDWSTIKTGPKSCETPTLQKSKAQRKYVRRIGEQRSIYTKIKQCDICQKYHPGIRKTCSKECQNQLLSQKMKKLIQDGHNPNKNRGRHKRSWLETSFEDWLTQNNVKNYITEQPFKRLDQVKTYFADFYFPELSLIIELDGTQHKRTQEYDQERDRYISSAYNVEIIRISHKEYIQKTKLSLVENKLGIC